MPASDSGGSRARAAPTLDNGAVVLAKETRKTPAVTINLAMRAGSICDPAGRAGRDVSARRG